VTADRYVEMLETFLRPKLDDADTEHVWFQQDGATAHTARRSLASVERKVPSAFDLFKGRRGVAGTVTRFKPM
jgi:hypothetical protein